MSPPSRGCGLKFSALLTTIALLLVTPFAGVWIEIAIDTAQSNISTLSPPSRGCGLKCLWEHGSNADLRVTPFAGVWIEI